MVSGQEHVGHPEPPEIGRARVVRVVEEPVLEGLALYRRGVADDSGDNASDRIDHDERRRLPPGEHVVPHRQLLVGQVPRHALVHSFISPAQDHEPPKRRELPHNRLRQLPPLGTQQDHARVVLLPLRRDRLDRAEQGLGRHHHARPSAVGLVVHLAMAVRRVVAKVVHADIDESALRRLSEERRAQERRQRLGEDRDDVYSHRGAPLKGV